MHGKEKKGRINMFSKLSVEGLIFVSFAWTIVISLLFFTMIKILKSGTDLEKTAKKKEKIINGNE